MTIIDTARASSANESTTRYNASMSTVSVQELQQNPAALLDRVEAGERLVLVRDGRPVAELRPVAPARPTPRPFGLCAGAFTVPDDFDAPLPDGILQEFEGR
jgi:prevent-host-death family protein